MGTFNMYTYQFNPIQNIPAGSLFDEYFVNEREQAMNQKNVAFEKAILKDEFYHRSRKLSVQFLFNQDNFIALKIANKRQVILEKEFVELPETDEPSALVLIYNDKEVQRIAIEQHRKAFCDTDIVASIIQRSISRILYEYKLNISIRKEYCATEFWDFVRANPSQIQMIKFEFDYPNLPRLREYVSDVIRNAGKSISGDKAFVQYEASDGALNLEENNQELQHLNYVSSEGGAPITFRLRGQREHHKTGQTTVTKEIDELDITVNNLPELQAILKAIKNE